MHFLMYRPDEVTGSTLKMCVFTLFQVIENGSSMMLSLQWEVSHFAISAMGAFSRL